jgi:fructose-bisphosphate aldolase/6-deoxy-5-ketofructose 1-phosphate synthase
MGILSIKNISIPLTVPQKNKNLYTKNYLEATQNTGRLFLFTGDQKIEHLNQDFYGPNICLQDACPDHMFQIASKSKISAFATHLGLIARYGQNYKNINYIVKLNAKTNLATGDPLSLAINSVEQVVEFKNNSKLNILGVGYTIFIGSEHETQMLSQAAEIVYQAHKYGLLAVLWIYPRGKAVKNRNSIEMISGAAGVGACLGADFIKVNPPTDLQSAKLLTQATAAAGNSGVICSGGSQIDAEQLLEKLYHQIHTGKTSGAAIGRNIHQRDLENAIKLCNAISAVIFENAEISEAKQILK